MDTSPTSLFQDIVQRSHHKRIETVPQILGESANGFQNQANVLHIVLGLGYRYRCFAGDRLSDS